MTDTGPPRDEVTLRQAIEGELQRLEESAMYSAQGQFEEAKKWRGINFGVGVPTSVFAAISGALVLADAPWSVLAGVLALAAAAGGAILTTVNAAQRMNQASSAGNAYLEVQTAARQSRLIDLPQLALDDARATLSELTARRDEQNKTAEVVSFRAYRKAKKNIDRGGQSYAADSDSYR